MAAPHREPLRALTAEEERALERIGAASSERVDRARRATALRRAGLPRVGATTIRRVLRDAGSSSQKTRTWCPTGTAERTRKAGVVTVVDPRTEEKRG